jgi:hypothetical protein
MPRTFDDVAACVESTLARVGPHIVLALPGARSILALRRRPPCRGWPRLLAIVGASLSTSTPAALRPYLKRMSLLNPRSRQEWLWQRLLVRELRAMI